MKATITENLQRGLIIIAILALIPIVSLPDSFIDKNLCRYFLSISILVLLIVSLFDLIKQQIKKIWT